MKRTCCLILVLAMLMTTAAYADRPLTGNDIEISAPSAILIEKSTGDVLYEKDADMRLFPASVTKIMTLLLIMEDIERGKLSLDDTVTASARASSFGGSCVYLEEGERMTVHEMLKCIAIVSANDCAIAMAEHISGTEQLFVARMNERAAELGLENTHFTGCTGLFDDADHFTTARDVAIMSRELIQHELIKDYTTIWMDSIRNGEFELSNTNKLVYWYPGCTGLKTGYTSSSMYCLSATAERDGVEYIAVIMRADSIEQRNNDAKTLLNYGFANYSLCSLRSPDPLPEVAVELGKADRVALEYAGEEFLLTEKTGAQPEYLLDLVRSISAPVKKGERLGTLTVRRGEETLAEVPLVAAANVDSMGFWGIFVKLAGSLFGI